MLILRQAWHTFGYADYVSVFRAAIAVIAAAGLVGGCVVRVDYSGTTFECDVGSECPDGFECMGGICLAPGTAVCGDMMLDPGEQCEAPFDICCDAQTCQTIDTGIECDTTNLLVRYPFDEADATTPDLSGNGRDADVSGAVVATGRFAGALQFDGVGDFAEDADAAAYLDGLQAVTVAVWVKSNAVGSDSGIFVGHAPDDDDGGPLSLRYDLAGGDGLGTNVIKLAVNADGLKQEVESASDVQTTEWQFLVMTWSSGADLLLYIDGVADTPTSVEPAIAGALETWTTLLIGKGAKDVMTSWDGLIDELRIYDRALTEAEITALFEM